MTFQECSREFQGLFRGIPEDFIGVTEVLRRFQCRARSASEVAWAYTWDRREFLRVSGVHTAIRRVQECYRGFKKGARGVPEVFQGFEWMPKWFPRVSKALQGISGVFFGGNFRSVTGVSWKFQGCSRGIQ